MGSKQHQKPHVILLSLPLLGHVTPLVHLALKLASKGFTISFIASLSIHHQITATAKTNRTEDIFSAFQDLGLDIHLTTVSDGLPPDFDRSNNGEQFAVAIMRVFPTHVEEAVKEIIDSGPPVSCLVADTFLSWAQSLAKKHELLYASFWTEAATVFTLYYHMDLLSSNGHIDCKDRREDVIDYIPGVESFPPKDLMSNFQQASPMVPGERALYKALIIGVKSADFVLSNSIQELELQPTLALQQKLPFFAIGPLLDSDYKKESEPDCCTWLDSKSPGSTLYISFGSYAHVSKSDISAIAHGLKFSQVSFVWVLRPDIVSPEDTDPLPDGFREEIGDRGIIIPWCSQKEVLSHPAIGGFLTHCGWNSILENQLPNRKLVVDDWKIGMNLCDNTAVTEKEVSEKINLLMNREDDEHNKLRDAIKKLKTTQEKALAGNGSAVKYLGHVTPLVYLAIKLASRGFTISFIASHSIHHLIASKAENNIFLEFQDPRLDIHYISVPDGRPLYFDRSNNEEEFITAIMEVYPVHVEEAIKEIIDSASPAVTVFSLYYHMDLLRSNGHLDCIDRREDAIDYIPGVESFPAKGLMSNLKQQGLMTTEERILYDALMVGIKSADIVFANNVQEIELQPAIALKQELPFFAVGPLIGSGIKKRYESECSNWLENKPPGSTLYISFGSYVHVSKTDIAAIANGLKLSQTGINLCDNTEVTEKEVSEKINILMKGDGKNKFINAVKELKNTMETALADDRSAPRTSSSYSNESSS
ncbi:OLC1v1003814C1 [Oldenlandia corymbosa var. corymbosa]|uniref:OLC1v1003814C1 n=1 Tax=Oldenlandia corymbosa var. corymbosa TaxID=529605 RepID=A0AAV1DE91_OLDCO|nr:OLC1v1003814C1 [Oldenlandia corymbosa var. corymbosa]